MNRWSVAWTVACLLCASQAIAQQRDPRSIEARKHCSAGNPEAGVALLGDIYAETLVPMWVYNQGRCWEQNARYQDSINRFREYLRVARNLTAEEKAEVEQHIAECQAELDKKSPTTPAPPAPTPVVAHPEPVPAPPAQVPAVISAPTVAPAPSSGPGLDLSAQAAPDSTSNPPTPFYKKWWFLTGAAAVVVGGAVTAILLATRSGSSGPCDGASLACLGVK